MNLLWTDEAWEDYLWWRKTDGKIFQRINRLIENTRQTPFSGLGKPEPLKHELSEYWSRRITDEHRLVYKVARQRLFIAQCRYHY
jgi:toxin YoeB